MTPRISAFATLFAIVSLSAICLGQAATGTPAYGSFGGGPFDTINLGNLNVHFAVPVVHKAGRGLPFTYDLSYDSSIWYPVGAAGSQTWTPVNNWGWRGQTEISVGYVTYTSSQTKCFDDTGQWYWGQRIGNYVYHDPWGISHRFPISLTCGNGTDTGLATDGSGYTATFNNIITTPSGQTFVVPQNTPNGAATATDANGNRISVNAAGVFTDTLNQVALTVAGTAPTPTTFTYTAPSGAAAAVTINYTAYNVKTNFGCSGVPNEYTATGVYLASSISMPDGSAYTLSYEATPGFSGYVTARLHQITLPTGGSLTYTYTGGNNGITCADGTTAGLTRVMSPGGTWTYSRSGTGNSWTTTVTDPKTPGNQMVANYQKDSATLNPSQNFYETQRKVYQGASTLLSTTITCYNGQSVGTPSSCPTTAVSSPISRLTVFRYLPDSTGVVAETDSTYDQFGLIHEVDEYDYGTRNPAVVGPILRKTITNYAALGNGIVDRPSSVVIEDSGNAVKATTTYTYDDPGSLTATSGIPQHVAISGSRGNLTSVAAKANATTTLYRKFTYYDTGTLNTSTDVSTSTTTNGATTTYVYASGTPSCNSAFPTTINEPLSLSRSMTWDCVGAVLTSLTDENSKQTSTSYTDPYFWRPHSATDAAGNTTTFAYSATQTETTLLFNSNNSVDDQLTTADGFGRTLLSQRKQGPSATNYDTTETDYDIAGCGISRTTLPYSATQGQTNATAPGTTTAYDGACRPNSVADNGGGSTTYTYAYNDTYETRGPAPTGENTKRKQLEYGGMGWLKSVCEVTAGTSAAPAGTCAQSSTATGYWTTYAYDTLGNQTGVVQNAQLVSTSQQTRTLSYDMLGRLASEVNPETNKLAVTYSYDSLSSDPSCGTVSSAGNLVKQVDAAGNASCYSYDSLHRVTSIIYPSTSTPQKGFVYDTATVNSATMLNAKTRLAEAYTCTGTCTSKITDLGFSYSSVGSVADAYESTPHSTAYYHLTSQYWPNGNVNTLSGLPGLPTITYGADPEGRTGTVSASSGQNPVTALTYNTGSQVSAITYGSADNDTFTFDPNTGRMSQYQFKMGSVVKTDTGVLTWNPNGSLKQLAITDQIYTGGTHTCNYTHDDLGRIATSNCGTPWNQTFTYDAAGNINKSATVGVSFTPLYDVTTNRMTTSPFTYDGNNGNLKTDSNHTYAWDTAGKMTSVDFGTANGVCLVYDALGRMVEQQRGSACTTSYTQVVYAPTGSKLALMNAQALVKAFVPLPSGQAVYTGTGLTYYRHHDWLGSSRLSTTPTRTMYYDTAYAPFGENYLGSGTMDLSFTGQNQDTIGGGITGNLYDFLYRQHVPVQGRWLSPDPAGKTAANPADPQSWNRYAYVGNRPLVSIDPLGLDCTIFDPFGDAPCGGGGGDGYCPPEYAYCGDDPFPDDGGGGFGPHPRPIQPRQRTGGVWANNLTPGLPPDLNTSTINFQSLLLLSPGLICAADDCGGSDFTGKKPKKGQLPPPQCPLGPAFCRGPWPPPVASPPTPRMPSCPPEEYNKWITKADECALLGAACMGLDEAPPAAASCLLLAAQCFRGNNAEHPGCHEIYH